jgi:hypothetical protein
VTGTTEHERRAWGSLTGDEGASLTRNAPSYAEHDDGQPSVTEPPAASIFSLAEAENACAVTDTLTAMSP